VEQFDRSGNCPTLPQCGKEVAILHGLRSRDVDDDDDYIVRGCMSQNCYIVLPAYITMN